MIDFSRHNAEVEEVWAAYRDGTPVRVPMLITSGPRIWILDPSLNADKTSWKEYLNNPDLFLEVCLRHLDYASHNIPQDWPMGIPKDAWKVHLEFGNVYEEAWFGCDVVYPEGQIAATLPAYSGDKQYKVLEQGMPGPFDGFMGKIRHDYEYIVEKARNMEYKGRPVQINQPVALGTDGPLTVANGIRGPEIFADMLLDEDYYHALMTLVTDSIINRILAWRAYFGLEPRPQIGWFADDAVQFLSTRTYHEKVLPYHRKLLNGIYAGGPYSVHLCGNVQRLMPVFVRELNVKNFDTGFPIHFSHLREEIGVDVEIGGGVPVSELVNNTPDQVFERSREILQSGIMHGGKFILKEANDLAPCTPIANLDAMYQAVHQYGLYDPQTW